MEILQHILNEIILSFQSPKIWAYLFIPVSAALIGWSTNILALKMTFYPIDFVGIETGKNEWFGIKSVGWESGGKIGWQGIIPSKAGEMAGKAVDLMLGKLIDVRQQFSQIDPKIIAEEMAPRMETFSREIIDQAMAENMPLVWKNLPSRMKEKIYEDAAQELPHAVEVIMQDVKNHIDELFDVKAMIVKELTANKKLLNYIFLKVGKDEFKFIERSGLYFGFLFGIIQMFISMAFPSSDYFMLPIGGVVVGYLTNFLALKLIFDPINPIKLGPITIQGLFIKRQAHVAKEYSKIVTSQILNTPNIFDAIMKGEGADKLSNIIQSHVQEAVDKTAGLSRSLIQITAGTKTYDRIKSIATERFIKVIPDSIKDIFEYAEEALDIENTIRDKMAGLPSKDFVEFLRPVFKEDELKLILIGAALGGLAGLLQLLIFFII